MRVTSTFRSLACMRIALGGLAASWPLSCSKMQRHGNERECSPLPVPQSTLPPQRVDLAVK